MCLGIPGQLVELIDENDQLAKVDVSGVTRTINIALVADEEPTVGDWVLVHVGFAMSKLDEEQAAETLAALKLLGGSFEDELDSFWSSGVGPTGGG